MHKRDKITVQTDLCSKQQGEQKGKIVSKRFQNYQSLPIWQGCWKNWYIILLYICKIGVRIVHIYYTWSSKFLFRWNFKLNVLYPYLSIHIRKSLPNIHRYGTPKLRFSESRFSEQKPAPLIVFYTIHCLGLVKFSV